MKQYIFTYITGIMFLILISVIGASAQEPKTVTDYLLSLPAIFFEYVEPGFKDEKNKPKTSAEIENYRRSRIVIEDIKNGYIKYKESPDLDQSAEIALFRKNSGGYLMAINWGGQYKGCESTLKFVEYNSGKWLDVTTQYALKLNKSELQKAKNSIFCYELPRQGRKVRLYSKWYDEPEDTWGYFEWDGEKFIDKP